MSLGIPPGDSVVLRAIVGELGSLETIEAKGTAVGFVDKREMLILVDVVLAVTEPLAAGPLPVMEETVPDVDGAGVGPEARFELALEEA